jgi:protein phosphatase
VSGLLDWFTKTKKVDGRQSLLSDQSGRNTNRSINDQKTTSKYRVSSCQSSGKERSHNEDAILVHESSILGRKAPVYTGVFLVADGMGGHQRGEEASLFAAEGASRFLMEKLIPHLFDEKLTLSDEDLQSLVSGAVKNAQDLILQRVPGGGTTLTLVLAVGDRLTSAHVGDSRLYIIHEDGKMRLQTKDHSLVNRLVELGEISPSEAGRHPQKNVLYRALGQSDALQPDINQFSLAVGERLLICSDGLWGVIEDKEIEEIIRSSDVFDTTTTLLVNAANNAGGPDNISVILVEKLA